MRGTRMLAKPRAGREKGLRSAALPALAMMLLAAGSPALHADETPPAIQSLEEAIRAGGSKTSRFVLTSGEIVVGRVVRIDSNMLLIRRPSAGLLSLSLSEITGVKIKAPNGEFRLGQLRSMSDGGIGWLAERSTAADQEVVVETGDQPDKGGPLIRLNDDLDADVDLSINQDLNDGSNDVQASDVELASLETPAGQAPSASNVTPVRLSVKTEEVSESGRLIYFRLTLSEPSSQSILIIYTMINGSASSPADYTHRQGVIVFEPGQTEAVVATSVIDDDTPEDAESFTFFVTGDPANVIIEERKVIATIADDDG